VTYIEAPTEFRGGMPSVFLAGEITDCPDWQAAALSYLDGPDVAVLNPRRADFPIHDPSATQQQIDWEYRHLRHASVILFWFAGGPSIQPIALYELGAHAASGKPLVVGCDPDYLRRADVLYQLGHVRPELTVFVSLAATCQAAADLLVHGWGHCRHCGIFIRRSTGPRGWWRGADDDGSLICPQNGGTGPHEPRGQVA
jgi:hypothetical protein